jgi:hypothetical protein
MGFALTIGSQVVQQRFTCHLGMQARPGTDPACLSQEIVAIDDEVKCHDEQCKPGLFRCFGSFG